MLLHISEIVIAHNNIHEGIPVVEIATSDQEIAPCHTIFF